MKNGTPESDHAKEVRSAKSAPLGEGTTPAIICPVCGKPAVQEKCKVVCRSETCRGRVIMNCSEFWSCSRVLA